MSALLDGCKFYATSTGTVDFVVASAFPGCMTPASAQAVNAEVYSYHAETADKSQWEDGYGAHTTSTTTQARSVVTYNSSGTGALQGGAGTKIDFSTVPTVALVAMKADIAPALKVLASGTDLNTITASGNYYAPADCSSLPEALASFLEVYTNSTSTVQRVTIYAGLTVYQRRNTPGSWSPWYSVGMAGSATPIVDGTATIGSSAHWAHEDHVHPTDTSRAPFDALAYSGMQINGSMEVSQDLGTTGSGTDGKYVADGWIIRRAGSNVITAAQVLTGGPAGIPSHIAITVGTAQASMGAGDYVFLVQPVEGYRVQRLGFGAASAQPITVGFWTAHHRTGTYSGAIRNSATNRSYPFTYTQNAADTWEYKTVTIPDDTTGTWLTGTSVGLSITFAMASGSTGMGTPDAWAAASYLAATGQVNGVAATSDVFRLTGVIVLPGIEAPSAARSPLIMRPYDQELLLCKRQFYKLMGAGAEVYYEGYGGTGTYNVLNGMHPVQMRAAPTGAIIGSWTVGNCTGPAINGTTVDGWAINCTGSGAMNRLYFYAATAPVGLSMDARL